MQNVVLALTALLAAAGVLLLGSPLGLPPAPAERVAAPRSSPVAPGAAASCAPASVAPGVAALGVAGRAPGGGAGEPGEEPLAGLQLELAPRAPRAPREPLAEARRVEALGRAAVEGEPGAREQAFEELCALALQRSDLARELRRALLLVVEAGAWPADALRFLPMAGVSRGEVARLAIALNDPELEVRRAAVDALGRAPGDAEVLLELELAFSREVDPVLAEEIAAAAVRVARAEAASVLERLLALPGGCVGPAEPVLRSWRDAIARGQLEPSSVFAAGSEHED